MLVFGVTDRKDGAASAAYEQDGPAQAAVAAIKDAVPEMVVVTDVCLCGYTDHGHCGVVVDGEVHNDLSLELLARTAVSHADAGADVVAPSDMMDGRVGAIRAALDAEGHEATAILSYSAKYASAFYGPFREAAGSAPGFGDRRGYQMDPANGREAVRETLLDAAEGADMVMVKPAARLPRRDRRGARRHRPAAGRLPRQRRVRDAQGGRRAGLARRAPGDPRDPDRHRPRRRRPAHHLLRALDAARWLAEDAP